MPVRAAQRDGVPEHAGTVVAYSIFDQDELFEDSQNTHVEFINEYTVEPDVRMEPHYHNSCEFCYILEGRGWYQIGEEKTAVGPGDLIYIPPNAAHTMWSSVPGERIRCFGFGAQRDGRDASYTVTDLVDLRD